jgi:dihydrofolate synthase/folylpolyglutamate synthase
LGGRLDATNVLEPLVTIITDISLDHVEILGSTLEEIAGEKAGIIKPGRPHLSGLIHPEAQRIIKQVCLERKSPHLSLELKDFSSFPDSNRIDFHAEGLKLSRVPVPLIGEHQLTNCALALKALAVLKQNGLRVRKNDAVRGISCTRWAGRFQVIQNGKGPTLILDVAHNVRGVAAFVRSFQRKYPGRSANALVGFVKRKEHQAMFDSLSAIVSHFQIVPLSSKRTVDVRELVATTNWHGRSVGKSGTVMTGFRQLLKMAGKDDIIIVIGSHYLVGELLKATGYK